jgi:tryptophanyl-tRNA synthetase
MKPRVFSGIQPSGSSTIGNYLGAIRNWARDQDRFDNIFCVVDLHAITTPQDPVDLRQRTWEIAAILLAAGIDSERSLLFVQSHVPDHAVLCWLLNTVTPIGWLRRMTQFKSKSGGEQDSVGTGLFDYPVLMAADILAYHANFVPVGEDQKQHVELTRDIAERFNALYGDTFTIPETMIPPLGARIMSLDDPANKMSKSDPAGALFLLDEPDTIRRKVARAVTDSAGVIRFSAEQPGLLNLLTILQLLSGETEEEVLKRLGGQGYRAVKEEVAERVIAALQPLQERYRDFAEDPQTVDEILGEGAARAAEIAGPVVRKVEERVGLRAPIGRPASAGTPV